MFQSIDITGFRNEKFEEACEEILKTLFVKFREVCGSLEPFQVRTVGPSSVLHFKSFYVSLLESSTYDSGMLMLDDQLDPHNIIRDRVKGHSREFTQYPENRVTYYAMKNAEDG